MGRGAKEMTDYVGREGGTVRQSLQYDPRRKGRRGELEGYIKKKGGGGKGGTAL